MQVPVRRSHGPRHRFVFRHSPWCGLFEVRLWLRYHASKLKVVFHISHVGDTEFVKPGLLHLWFLTTAMHHLMYCISTNTWIIICPCPMARRPIEDDSSEFYWMAASLH